MSASISVGFVLSVYTHDLSNLLCKRRTASLTDYLADRSGCCFLQ